MFSFRLTEEFIEPFKTAPVDWGFPDAAGNAVGEITFLRTYSRIKPCAPHGNTGDECDCGKEKERWWEVCRRVIDGMFSIQKDYAKTNRLPWNDRKAHASAQEAYERLFALKWTPPGRGLWTMGTPLVMEQRNSAGLLNCLTGDTEVYTGRGIHTLADMAGQSADVLTEHGWHKGEFKAFGVQPIQRITLAPAGVHPAGGWRALRSNVRRTVTATPDHRWVLTNGEVTQELAVGDVVPAVADAPDEHNDEYRRGRAHGIVFADGTNAFTYADGAHRFEVRLCGPKAALMYEFDADSVNYSPSCDGDPTIVFTRVNDDWKALPVGRSPRYVAGFLRGWIDGDAGSCSSGSVILGSTHPDAGAWLDKHAPLAGMLRVGYSTDDRDTNYGPRTRPLTKHVLAHADGTRAWKVVGIEVLPEPEQVYCAVVPETTTFTLAGGILTGNCAYVDMGSMTRNDPAEPLCWLMEASMLGIGVGFGTVELPEWLTVVEVAVPDGFDYFELLPDGRAAAAPLGTEPVHHIPDTREGWVESVRVVLNAYFKGERLPIFDYSAIRPEGAPIKTFGGTAAGPGPLRQLHTSLIGLLSERRGPAGTLLIGDIANLIGVCVVAGNVRRSAELWMGALDDKDFLNAKNYGRTEVGRHPVSPATHPELFPHFRDGASDDSIPDQAGVPEGSRLVLENGRWMLETSEWVPGPAEYRADYGWMSNNSVSVNVGDDLSPVIEGIARNGEPGVIWMDLTRTRGRLIDPPNDRDRRAAGYNPCAEQPLESYEQCTLVETYLNRHDDLEDFQRTLKFAYMYGKTATLVPTHWPRSNAIMQRNRRIGCSMSGIADFADNRGMTELRRWMNEGYATVKHYDEIYSEWLCVRASNRTTTVKPSGTVSIVAGSSPGVHWGPGGAFFNRGIVFDRNDPIVALLAEAGYAVETSAYTPDSSVFVQFPIRSHARRSQHEVTLFEKANLAVLAQRYWSDNSVSVTLTFDPASESEHVATVLHMHDGQLKTVSFLPSGNKTYAQMPYQQMTEDEWEAAGRRLAKIDFGPLYDGTAGQVKQAEGEAYCTTDTCQIPVVQ